MTAGVEHTADRQSWDCRVCATPWPCPTAREQLLTEFSEYPSMLVVHLFGLMGEAAAGLRDDDDLQARFVGWVSPVFTLASI